MIKNESLIIKYSSGFLMDWTNSFFWKPCKASLLLYLMQFFLMRLEFFSSSITSVNFLNLFILTIMPLHPVLNNGSSKLISFRKLWFLWKLKKMFSNIFLEIKSNPNYKIMKIEKKYHTWQDYTKCYERKDFRKLYKSVLHQQK